MEEKQKNEKKEEKCPENETIKLKYGYYIAIIGLIITAIVAIVMMLFSFKTASDIVAVIGVFTSIIGTIVGAFIGVEIGASGKKDTEKLNAKLEKEKVQINNDYTNYKKGVTNKLKEIDSKMSSLDTKSLETIPCEELGDIRNRVNRMMSSTNYILGDE